MYQKRTDSGLNSFFLKQFYKTSGLPPYLPIDTISSLYLKVAKPAGMQKFFEFPAAMASSQHHGIHTNVITLEWHTRTDLVDLEIS